MGVVTLTARCAAYDTQAERDAAADGRDGIKWTTMEHSGVLFPPEYEPHGVPLGYGGEKVFLTPEEVRFPLCCHPRTIAQPAAGHSASIRSACGEPPCRAVRHAPGGCAPPGKIAQQTVCVCSHHLGCHATASALGLLRGNLTPPPPSSRLPGPLFQNCMQSHIRVCFSWTAGGGGGLLRWTRTM